MSTERGTGSSGWRFRSVWGAGLGLVLGIVATRGVQSWRARAPRVALTPLVVGRDTVLLPPGARILDAVGPTRTVSWARPHAPRTRCGAAARVELRESRNAIPDGVSHCWEYDFSQGSASGECPPTTVCIARRGGTEMTCTSDDRACEAVVAAFVANAER